MLYKITYNKSGIIKFINFKRGDSTMKITLEGKNKKYIELYEKIVNLINENELKPKEKLPSKRDLAIDLDVSINTVMNAYMMLLDEGYIYSIEKKGYFVTKQPIVVKKPKEISNTELKKDEEYLYDFTTSKIEDFATTKWLKLIKSVTEKKDYLNKTDYLGDIGLRFEIQQHLKLNRGINTPLDNILICNGFEAIEKILELTDIDDLLLENPGYHKLSKLNINKKISYQNIDDYGVLVPNKRCILYTTPFCQFPTGIKMSISRKKELINFVNKTDSLIIEDDFDAEFRINGQRAVSLYTLDREKVIFFSSFTTTMYPGLRLAYIILPDKLLSLYKDKYNSYSSLPTLEQLLLKEFIKSGEYASHINKIKRLYLKKRQLIIETLSNYNYLIPDEKKSYLSIPIKINTIYNDSEIKEVLKNNKIKISLLSDYDINKKDSKILILGYTAIPLDKIKDGINTLAKALKTGERT